ncbi:MAG: DUF3089 domain-containing protein [Bacteroidia bacterium]|nr:DUF3089 domain-containing protein [Bacteroidia bacterium]
MQRVYLFILLALGLFACGEYPENHPALPFDQVEVPAAGDYSDPFMWVAHPNQKDWADTVPVDTLKDRQETAEADLFFIYPTMFNSLDYWISPLNDSIQNERVETRPIKHQASIFNGSCRIFAPRYRQMTYGGFFCADSASKRKSLLTAYSDVKAAFEYYLAHENKGRPIVIAGHSQGSFHGKMLLKEFFDGKPLQDQLVAAYLPGWPIQKDYFNSLEASDSASQVGAVCTWNTFLWGYIPEMAHYYKGAICTNPLSWKSDGSYGSQPCSKGMVFYKYNKIYNKVCDAQENEDNGYLWVHKPDIPQKMFLTMKNYHVADFNLFWLDVRKNVAQRLTAYQELHAGLQPEHVAHDHDPEDAPTPDQGVEMHGPR